MNRTILHSDMNCFYASVEMMLNPELQGKAVAVCGSTENRHGIVLAKSEKAKQAGIKTGMVNWEAKRLCPDLILVPPQYEQYLKYSNMAREIYQEYTDLVEPYGMDECFLDVTASQVLYGSGKEIADQIRCRMKNELGLTVSIGISFNKIFAKLGSDGKKLTEMHIDDWMIARLLGHKTLQSVHHYRKIGNKIMADETRAVREKIDMILMDVVKEWDGYEI